MRNVKVLWVLICLLLGSVLYLLLFEPSAGTTRKDLPPVPDDLQETGENRQDIVAQIGDRFITTEQLQGDLAQRYGKETLQQMIDHVVIALEGAKRGMVISEQMIEDELERMQHGYDSKEQFFKSMKEQLGLSEAQLREDIIEKLMIESITIDGIAVSEEAVDEYIRTHPEEMNSYIFLHLQQMLLATKEEAELMIMEVENGADFGMLAQKHSLDDVSADDGGDLGWVDLNDPFIPSELMNVAKKLQNNELSKPIKLSESYAILRLVERKEPDSQEKQKIRNHIRTELALSQAPSTQNVIQQLRERWNVKILKAEYK